MVKQIKKLRITHIDDGTGVCHPSNMDVGLPLETGAWPKVSFSDGNTFSYMWLTNTKVILFTARAKTLVVDSNYTFLMNEFYNSSRPFKQSNWLTQRAYEDWPIDIETTYGVASGVIEEGTITSSEG